MRLVIVFSLMVLMYFLVTQRVRFSDIKIGFSAWREKRKSKKMDRSIAKRGEKVAGNARKDAEKELGRPVTTKQNYLSEPEKQKKIVDKSKK